jgi:hypothetical protein
MHLSAGRTCYHGPMKLHFNLAMAAVLAASAPCALADTIYKCVQENGTVAFSSLPCAGQAKQARQLTVPAPEADDVSAARLKQESARLRTAEKYFQKRQAKRDAEYANMRPQYSIPQANVPASKAAAQPDKQNAERAEAKKLNAARNGNCSMRRPEANCL